MRSGDLATFLDEAWRTSRSGAIAGRGYHYQDIVGAWVGLLALTAALRVERVIPEGLEDISCEGEQGIHVQVKSRQSKVGEFRCGEAAKHIVDAAERHFRRPTRNERLVVVFERAIGGQSPTDWATTLAEGPVLDELMGSIVTTAAQRKMSAAMVEDLVANTTVIVQPQLALRAAMQKLVAQRTGLPLRATLPVLQAMRCAVAERADRNAGADWKNRSGLTVTDLARIVADSAALVDRESLDEAIASGACEILDFDSPLDAPDFFAGTAVQPGHIAAGLVVPRPHLTDAVLAALNTRGAALVCGPSGIGKSAVMFMAAYVARHVIWYRVHRLKEEDVEPLVRLARASGNGTDAPVGFIVDGVGTGALHGWDALYRRLVAVPGALLLGTMREEDGVGLETFGDSPVVRPRLDEDLAARVHAALLERGLTSLVHWREAFALSRGLTLEFTHVLTRGRRLDEVVRMQVAERIRESRIVELDVLALVSVADRWGAGLTVDAVGVLSGVDPAQLKVALTRLVDEHLVTLNRGRLRGLHPLRSGALAEAIHDVPPPDIAGTVRRVVKGMEADELGSFIEGVLAALPDLGDSIVVAVGERIGEARRDSAVVAAAALDGLRMGDFIASARIWAGIIERCQVPRPIRPLTVNLAMFDIELIEAFDPRLRMAVAEIRRLGGDAGLPLRDSLLAKLGPSRVAALVASSVTPAAAVSLLAALAATGIDLSCGEFSPDCPFREVLRKATLEELGNLATAAASISAQSGNWLVVLTGGVEAMVRRLAAENPWVLDLRVDLDGGERVIRGRVLHVSDRLNPDPEGSVRNLARLALLCLPDVDRADLSTVWAGGVPMRVGDLAVGVSRLSRRYATSAAEVAWNRRRISHVQSIAAADSETARLSNGLRVLERAGEFQVRLMNGWCVNGVRGKELDAVNEVRMGLLAEIDRLPSRPSQGPGSAQLGGDAFHAYLQGAIRDVPERLADSQGYRSLAAFVGDLLRKRLADLRGEPWGLLGLDGPPPVIERLEALLTNLHAVLAELAFGDTTAEEMARAARTVRREAALERMAALARAHSKGRYERRTTKLKRAGSAQGLRMEILHRQVRDAPATTWPPWRTGALLALDSMAKREEAVRILSSLVSTAGLPDGTLAVIPTRLGTPLPELSWQVTANGKSFPLFDAANDWLTSAMADRPLELSGAVRAASSALQELSALAYLSRCRDTGSRAQAVADEASKRLSDALATIEGLPKDAVTTGIKAALLELVRRVVGETETAADGPGFAQAIALGLNDANQEVRLLNWLSLLASEWDVSPSTAVSMLSDC